MKHADTFARFLKRAGSISTAIGCSLAFVLLCAWPSTSAWSADKVTIAYDSVVAYAPLYIALDKGYFKDEGIETELISFATGISQMTATAAGQVDFGFGPVSAALFNAVGKGLELKAVASLGTLAKPLTITQLVVRKELYDKGEIKGGANLAGRRVGVNTIGGSIEYKLSLILESHGMKFKDVNEVILTYPDMLSGFSSGGIDAAIMGEPLATEAKRRGLVVVIPDDSEIGAGTAGVVVTYGEKFIRQRPEVGVRAMKALIRGSRDLQDGKWRDPANVAILAKYTKLPPEVILEATFPAFDPDLAIEPYAANIKSQMDMHIKTGRMSADGAVPIEKVIDGSFVKKAVEQLKK